MSRSEYTLRRDEDRALLDSAARNTADDLDRCSKARLSAEQLLHAANCWCVFEKKQLGKVDHLNGETCLMLASTQMVRCSDLPYLRLRD